eukprot:g30744.t1
MSSLITAGMSEMRAIFGMSSSSRAGPSPAHASGSTSGSGSAARGSGSGGSSVWISIDPRSGELSRYPEAAARRLEQAHRNHERQVRLGGLGLGPIYETLIVDLGGSGERPVQKRVGGGKRDVRRVETPAGASEVRVHVVRDRGWRISDDHVADIQGLVGLWEWCRDAETHNPGRLAADRWAIELAFRNGAKHAEIAVGIRSYEVLFEGASMAGKQVDKRRKKRRFVRRRAVQMEEREAALQSVESAVAAASDAECVICAESFADTYAMPVVRLRECGHIFHGACVQDLADRRKTCPYCRAQVNWKYVEEVQMFSASSNMERYRTLTRRVEFEASGHVDGALWTCPCNETEVVCKRQAHARESASAFMNASYPSSGSLAPSRGAVRAGFLAPAHAAALAPSGAVLAPSSFSEGWIDWAKSNPLMVLGLVTPIFSIVGAALTGHKGVREEEDGSADHADGAQPERVKRPRVEDKWVDGLLQYLWRDRLTLVSDPRGVLARGTGTGMWAAGEVGSYG